MSEHHITFEDLKLRLTPAQRRAAQLIVENDFAAKGERKTLGEIAEELSIDQRTLYNWRQNPDFTRYMAALSDGELATFRSLADSQLVKLIKGTSNNGIPAIRALELFYRLEGRLVERSVVTTDEKAKQPTMTRAEASEELERLNRYIN